MAGYIKLYRKICENPLWLEEMFTKAQAWLDLILNANHKEGGFYIRGGYVTLRRGQIAWSEEFMAKRWRWSRGKVRRFILSLERGQQAVQDKSFIISVITIKNYSKYQNTVQQSVQQTVHTPKKQELRNKNTDKESTSYEVKEKGMRGMEELINKRK